MLKRLRDFIHSLRHLSNTLRRHELDLEETKKSLGNVDKQTSDQFADLKKLSLNQSDLTDRIKELLDQTRETVFERSEFLENIYKSLSEFKELSFQQFETLAANQKHFPDLQKTVYERSEFLENVYKSLSEFKELSLQQFETLTALQHSIKETVDSYGQKTLDNVEDTKNLGYTIGDVGKELSVFSALFNRQNKKIENLLSDLRASLSQDNKKPIDSERIEKNLAHLNDYKYVMFEQKYRGDPEAIKKKQEIYLSHLSSIKGLGKPVLDVGCGRGEFLELCKMEDIVAKGVELNESMLDICNEKGLDVVSADAFEYLASQPDDSFAGIVSFQFIEHLSPDQATYFIDLTFRKLCEGGVVVIETINPECLYAMKWFYIDISHKFPFLSATLQTLLESTGFKEISTEYLTPVPEYLRLRETENPVVNENIAKLNNLLFGNQEYYTKAMK